MELSLIQNLAAMPIDDASPTGRDVLYEDDFLALSAELDKAEGIDVQPIDWSVVGTLALRILKEQSKDLRVAGYLSVALYHQQGFAGLAAGFVLFRELVDADYWDDLYPKRAKRQNKARAAAFDWVIKKLERPMDEVDIQSADLAAVIEASQAFVELDRALAGRLGDDAPANMFDLRNTLNRFRQEAEHLQQEREKTAQPAEPKPVPKAPPQAPAAQAKTPEEPVRSAPPAPPAPPRAESAAPAIPAPVVQDVASNADIERVLTANGKSVEKICELLRQQRLTDPRAFYLLRTSKWMILDKLPPNGVIPMLPSEERLKYLAVQEQAKQYELLIRECEKTFAGGAIFHLGLHRMVANALQALGAAEACSMVKICVAQLLARFPGYLEQRFANQQGFADARTRDWIETEVLPAQAAESAEPAPAADSEPWLAASKTARKLIASGQFDQGIALFREGIQSAVNERETCFWQLEQARYCLDAGHLEIALPQLTHLYKHIHERQLQRWEPELNLAIIKLLLACHGKKQSQQKYPPEQQQHVDVLRTQLCLMDPLGALSL